LNVEESRLAVLFDAITEATRSRRYSEALRLADSARRFVPDNPTAILLHARLALEAGDPRTAAVSLRGRDDRESLILHAEAALHAGLIEEAMSSTQTLLARFAVDSLPELPKIAARLCRVEGGSPGWVGIDTELHLVGEIPGDCVARIYRGTDVVGDIVAEGGDEGGEDSPGSDSLGSFAAEISAGRAGVLRVRVGERELLGSGLSWPPYFDPSGWVVLEGNELRGQVCLNWTPHSAVTLLIDCGSAPRRVRVEPPVRREDKGGAASGWPFSIELDLDTVQTDIEVAALLPDGRRAPLIGSPLKLPQPAPRPIGRMTTAMVTAPAARTKPREVNIVVPVHSGLEETLACLRSVLRTMPRDAVLTVVHDAGPDAALRQALEEFDREGRVSVLWNAVNLGFPGAANRGMRQHPQRDVILLNADTEVFDGWVERLRAVAYAKEHTGAVTPFGEAASIMSYPGNGAAPSTSAEAERIDRIAREVNTNRVIEIPVGVGFCMYLRRTCLDDVGEFDEQSFDKGYGEENDFCLRAREKGWRHVAAAGVFVRHVGARSYGRAKELLSARNQRVIDYRYPGYDALIRSFLDADPLKVAKRALDRGRLLEAAYQPVLLLSMHLAGGVKRHVDDRQAALLALGHSVLIMRGSTDAKTPGRVVISVVGADFEHLIYDLPRELEELRTLLTALRLVHIELHHFLGLPAAALDMVVGMGVPYHAYIHDYAWICPRVSLLNGEGRYCGEPVLEVCETCVQTHGSAFAEPISVTDLRARSARILAAAERIVAPTEDVRRRLARYVASAKIDVIPWQKPSEAIRDTVPAASPQRAVARGGVARSDSRRVRVVLLGAIGTPKGYEVLLQCARDAATRNLPLEFIVIGYTRDDAALRATSRVAITGLYQEQEVAALIGREGGDIAWFPSVTPETWSYTLTHAIENNLPIVAFDIGAIAERLRAAGTGMLLPLSSSPESINQALLSYDESALHLPVPATQNEEKPKDEPTRMTAPEPDAVPPSPDIAATVQVLTLPVGIYAFTVQSGTAAADDKLVLPALQVAPAPLRSAGVIEFLSGPRTMDRWLTATGDVLTVKVSVAAATVVLTSLRAPDNSAALSIDIRRLDAPAAIAEAPAPSPPPPQQDAAPPQEAAVPPALNGVKGPRIATKVHLPYVGDLEFTGGWAGRPAENLWIEGFAATPLAPIEPDLIEYCGLNEAGEFTDWVSGGKLCGSRGAGVPLVAFAARVKSAAASTYVCHYSGQFLSGNVVGPFSDGRFCRSDAPEDPLVALELRIEATAD
jgi:GT2 family glycosyltransferase/glycosyltransferase involved in cell wall biosynthesis